MNDRGQQSGRLSREERLAKFREICAGSGLRITPQRVAIYESLLEMESHPSAEQVLKKVREKFSNISLDTVNRTLLTLCSMGLCSTLEGSGDARRFDGIQKEHHHFKCLRCKKIIDVDEIDGLDVGTPAELAGCEVVRRMVYFEGRCAECRAEVTE